MGLYGLEFGFMVYGFRGSRVLGTGFRVSETDGRQGSGLLGVRV